MRVRFVIRWRPVDVSPRFRGVTLYAATSPDWVLWPGGPNLLTFTDERKAWEFIRSYVDESGARPVLAFVHD
jgi:hypothetical protein